MPGYVDVQVQRADRVDMAYDPLARYVGTRAAGAVQDAEGEYRDVLQRAADAASRWALRDGTFNQCWIEITARWPGGAPPSPPPAPDARARASPPPPTRPQVDSGDLVPMCWPCHRDTGAPSPSTPHIEGLTRMGHLDDGWHVIGEINSDDE